MFKFNIFAQRTPNARPIPLSIFNRINIEAFLQLSRIACVFALDQAEWRQVINISWSIPFQIAAYSEWLTLMSHFRVTLHTDACHSVHLLQTRRWMSLCNDGVIKRKNFPHYSPFVRGIHRSPEDYPHKCQWPGPWKISLIWTNVWANNRYAGDLRRQRALWPHSNAHVLISIRCTQRRSVDTYFTLHSINHE